MSLPPDKFLEMQQLVHSLLQRLAVLSPSGYVLFEQDLFCAKRHALICQLCCFIQSGMLNVYHSPAHLFPSLSMSPGVLSMEGTPLAPLFLGNSPPCDAIFIIQRTLMSSYI